MPNTINEKIYAPYTKHMTRAKTYTYRTGYEVIDQALVKDYYRKSIRQIADELNEYDQRVIYRIQVLLKIGVASQQEQSKTNCSNAKCLSISTTSG